MITHVSGLVGGCDHASAGVHLLHLDDPIRQGAHHVGRVVKMAGFVLVQFGHGGEGVGGGGAIDDGTEGLDGSGVCLEESNFGVAEGAVSGRSFEGLVQPTATLT